MKIVLLGLLPFLLMAALAVWIMPSAKFFTDLRFLFLSILLCAVSGMLMLSEWNKILRRKLNDTSRIITVSKRLKILVWAFTPAVIVGVICYYYESRYETDFDWSFISYPIIILNLIVQCVVHTSENIKLRRRLRSGE